MNLDRLLPWLIGCLVLVVLAATVGWTLGSGSATGDTDAETARRQGYEEAFDLVYRTTHAATRKRGFVAGAKRGKVAGAKTGAREGADIGAGNAQIEESVVAAKSAESAEAAAESEIAARQANCGIVAAAPGWCPTSEEASAYRAAVQAAREAEEQAAKEKKKEKPGGRD